MNENDGILLKGLDGSNPLAFLAALGTLRTLTLALPGEDVKMRWEQYEGAWRPRVLSPVVDRAQLLDAILSAFALTSPNDHPVMAWSAWISKEAANVRAQFAKATMINSRCAAFTSAIGSDAAPPTMQEGLVDNPFRAARTDYFIKNLTAIINGCDRKHLDSALFCIWDYADAMENQSLRVDASEDRRHAYQWDAPTTDKSRQNRGTMLGANRLAIEAFEFFQSCMSHRALATVGFGIREGSKRCLRWPIWGFPCDEETVRSIMSLTLIWNGPNSLPDRRALREMGIVTVGESWRIKIGDSNPRTNFTPSRFLF